MVRAVAFLLVALAACSSTQVLDRAEDGTPILIRGPQPTATSLSTLRELEGVRTVVNLRGESPGKAWFEEERKGVEAVGAKWIHIKASGHEPPPPEALHLFFDVVEDRANWPVLIHCQSGMHRTGVYAAVYRMQYQGWTPERAWEEMRANGFTLGKGKRDTVERWVHEYRPDPARRVDRGAPIPPTRPGGS
jgi:protein tyrosine/serine phosphatase